jgi:bifunctional UDP-N-acetylglucosamine pyrophosphorylase/glucosamine-1-phosphate N-acetyltransferase
VEGLCVDDPRELRGVNTRADLADLARDLRARKNRALMLDGVTLEDPATTYVDIDVVIGADTRLGPGVVIEGASRLGRDCVVRSGARISNAVLGDRVTVLDRSVIADSTVGSGVQIGPFAHLRPGCVVGDEARIGNFVELKKTRLGQRSKASHLAYLGDATIGDDVNIGAGTITCNYDGAAKHPTIIEDGVFIGSDSQLVAPVRIGRGAYVAAGSTITHDVPPDALGVARSRQENKDGWAARRRARRGQEPH